MYGVGVLGYWGMVYGVWEAPRTARGTGMAVLRWCRKPRVWGMTKYWPARLLGVWGTQPCSTPCRGPKLARGHQRGPAVSPGEVDVGACRQGGPHCLEVASNCHCHKLLAERGRGSRSHRLHLGEEALRARLVVGEKLGRVGLAKLAQERVERVHRSLRRGLVKRLVTARRRRLRREHDNLTNGRATPPRARRALHMRPRPVVDEARPARHVLARQEADFTRLRLAKGAEPPVVLGVVLVRRLPPQQGKSGADETAELGPARPCRAGR